MNFHQKKNNHIQIKKALLMPNQYQTTIMALILSITKRNLIKLKNIQTLIYCIENIILNYLKKSQMMNYLTLMPNYICPNGLQTPYILPVNPQKEIRTFPNIYVLNALSQALNSSLRNYQNQYKIGLQNSEKQEQRTPCKPENTNNSSKVIEIIISEEENIQNLKIPSTEDLNTVSPKNLQNSEKQKILVQQPVTDDEIHLESKDAANKKEGDIKKKNRKYRKQEKPDSFIVDIPQVDPIDTAYLPQLSYDFQGLAKKKQELLNRRVGDWSDYIKVKKERRQIRMLGN